MQLGLGLGTGNGYFIGFFPCLKVTNTFVLLSWPGLVRHPGLGHVSEGTPREVPRTPVGNTGSNSFKERTHTTTDGINGSTLKFLSFLFVYLALHRIATGTHGNYANDIHMHTILFKVGSESIGLQPQTTSIPPLLAYHQ